MGTKFYIIVVLSALLIISASAEEVVEKQSSSSASASASSSGGGSSAAAAASSSGGGGGGGSSSSAAAAGSSSGGGGSSSAASAGSSSSGGGSGGGGGSSSGSAAGSSSGGSGGSSSSSAGSSSSSGGDDDSLLDKVGDSVCFPADAEVVLENGVTKSMNQIQLGDRVMVGNNKFSEVFAFTHAHQNAEYEFFKLSLNNRKSIELTEGHYIYINDIDNLLPASNVKVGDSVFLHDSSKVTVTQVDTVRKSGLFNPQTIHGDIVVNGVTASTYTDLYTAAAAHTLLAPLRLLYRFTGLSTNVIASIAETLH